MTQPGHMDMDPDAVERVGDRYWNLGLDMITDWEEAEREISRLEGRLIPDELTAAFRQSYDARAQTARDQTKLVGYRFRNIGFAMRGSAREYRTADIESAQNFGR